MPIARAIAPDGAVLSEHARPTSRRAIMSAKAHQVVSRRLSEFDFELINTYPVGTKIEVGGEPPEFWDGKAWGPEPPAKPKKGGGE